MRTNNIPVSIMATALAASQLQAFVVPSVAMGVEWNETTLGQSAHVTRQVEPWSSIEGQYPGTVVRVSVQVSATQECGQFWVVDNYLTDDLAKQGFHLLMEGNMAPQSLPSSTSSVITVQPRISTDGKTLGFTVPRLLAGQTAGIQYYLHSPHTAVTGDELNNLADWIRAKDSSATPKFAHLGTVSMSLTIPADPKLNLLNNTGDAYADGTLTVSLDTLGGNQLSPLTIEKRLANALGSQLPTPAREGYDFKGWYFDSALTQPLQAESIPSYDFTLYAKWDQAENSPTGVLGSTTETPEQATQSNAATGQTNQVATGSAARGTAGSTSSAKKGDLVSTGENQTMAVIVASASVVTGLSVLVLRRLQR